MADLSLDVSTSTCRKKLTSGLADTVWKSHWKPWASPWELLGGVRVVAVWAVDMAAMVGWPAGWYANQIAVIVALARFLVDGETGEMRQLGTLLFPPSSFAVCRLQLIRSALGED